MFLFRSGTYLPEIFERLDPSEGRLCLKKIITKY